ncbi:MAG: acyl carrier protein [Acidobacteriota bacterium]|nr:acyl carrier protein [Acidobacteriota bacterium]
MEIEVIKTRIKEIIYEATSIDPEDIGDTTHFIEELELDSLTMLEIGVDIDQEYQLDLPDEEMKQFANLQVTAEIVLKYMEKKAVKG